MSVNLLNIEIENCVKVLKRGGTLLYPTDTIWGIGCDATLPESVSKIYRIKHREEDRSFIVLVSCVEQLSNYVEVVPDIAKDLLQAVDSPLTIIYPKGKRLAENVMGKDGSIAIRVVKTEFCKKLLQKFGKPIVSTSANISGEPSPIHFNSISPLIKSSVDHIVMIPDAIISEVKPSRIIKIEDSGMFEVIRE